MGINVIEAAGAVLIGALFYGLASSQVVKNSGTLESPADSAAAVLTSADAGVMPPTQKLPASAATTATGPVSAEYGSADDVAAMYASSGIDGSPSALSPGYNEDVSGLATSLLPNKSSKLDDDDFVSISPDLHLTNVNFMTGWQLGRDTAGADKRNMSLDLRSETPNPRFLTPENNLFNNSSIGFFDKRTFEIAEYALENPQQK